MHRLQPRKVLCDTWILVLSSFHELEADCDKEDVASCVVHPDSDNIAPEPAVIKSSKEDKSQGTDEPDSNMEGVDGGLDLDSKVLGEGNVMEIQPQLTEKRLEGLNRFNGMYVTLLEKWLKVLLNQISSLV